MKHLVLALSIVLAGCASGTPPINYQTANYQAIAELPDADDPTQAMIDARLHAEQDYKTGAGICLGGGCGLFGVAASAIYEDNLPAHRLLALKNKSNAYTIIYKEAYVKEIKKKRTREATGTWLVGVAFLFMVLVATSSSSQ